MAQETNQSPVPTLCANGCGFYGNPRTNGMCSVCHKEHLSRQNNGGVSTLTALGGSSGSSAEASAIQRLEATLNNAAAAAVAAAEEAAEAAASAASNETFGGGSTAMSVTQQMTEMSLSCEEKGASGSKVELTEPVLTQPTSSASHPSTAGSELSEAPEPQKPKKNRCFMCRKKVGLTVGMPTSCFVGQNHPLKSRDYTSLLAVKCLFSPPAFFPPHKSGVYAVCCCKTSTLNLY